MRRDQKQVRSPPIIVKWRCFSEATACWPRTGSTAAASGSSATRPRWTPSLRHIADRLAAHPGARLTAIFGPQHGFRSDVQDNMIETGHAHDEVRRVPVYSLYSETREPTPEMLRGPRRARDRPPGRRRAHLHLHLHDGELPEGGARGRASRSSSATVRTRSAARRSKAWCSCPASSRSWGCTRSRCATA